MSKLVDHQVARILEATDRDVPRTTGLTNPPGVTMSYSTTAWNVFGRIVEVVTGGTWDEALRELLRTPLFGVRATARSGRDA